MIAIDTNVLLRYLLADDEIQAKKTARLIESKYSVYVSHVVLDETIWTLKGKKYKLSPQQIDETITALFEERNIVIQDEELVWRALADYRIHAAEGNSKLDFLDALLVGRADNKYTLLLFDKIRGCKNHKAFNCPALQEKHLRKSSALRQQPVGYIEELKS